MSTVGAYTAQKGPKPLQIEWTRHLIDQDRREDFEKVLRNNTLLFKRLHDILSGMEQELTKDEVNKNQYQSASWACLQAHRNGNRETLKKLKDLISFAL